MDKRFKPRFENCIEDYETHNTIHCGDRIAILKILNEQDKKIKSYEKLMNKYNVEDLEHLDLMLLCLSSQTKYLLSEIKEKHKKELQQSQNSKAVEVLEKVKQFCTSNPDWNCLIDTCILEDFIDNQITELRGGEND